MTELDPCPFCGGKAEWDEKNKAPQCTQCKATIPSAGGILRKYFDKSNYRQYMAALWNRGLIMAELEPCPCIHTYVSLGDCSGNCDNEEVDND